MDKETTTETTETMECPQESNCNASEENEENCKCKEKKD